MTWLWSKFTGYLVAAAGLFALLAGIRYKIRSTAREELQNEMRERTLERIEAAREVDDRVDGLGDDDILERLREQGWLRD